MADLAHALCNPALRDTQPNVGHGLAKKIAIFGFFNGGCGGTDHFNTEFFQNPSLGNLNGRVQAGLPAKGRQKGIGFFALNDQWDRFGSDRFDIGSISRFRVGHDGGGIRVDQDDFEPFLFEGLAGLGPGIIKFTCLADDDRAGTDN